MDMEAENTVNVLTKSTLFEESSEESKKAAAGSARVLDTVEGRQYLMRSVKSAKRMRNNTSIYDSDQDDDNL